MGGAKRLRDAAVDREAGDDRLGFGEREAGALDEDAGRWLHRARALDEGPFSGATRDVREERGADGVHSRTAPGDDEDWDARRLAELVDVDDVEAGESDALKQDGLGVGREARGDDQRGEGVGGVAAVAADPGAEDALHAEAREGGRDDEHVAPVLASEGGVVDADDVRVL